MSIQFTGQAAHVWSGANALNRNIIDQEIILIFRVLYLPKLLNNPLFPRNKDVNVNALHHGYVVRNLQSTMKIITIN